MFQADLSDYQSNKVFLKKIKKTKFEKKILFQKKFEKDEVWQKKFLNAKSCLFFNQFRNGLH